MRCRRATTAAVAAVAAVGLACGPRPTPSQIAAPATGMPWEASGIDWSTPPAPGPAPRFAPPRARELVLDNGLRALLVDDPALPLVSVRLVIGDAGSARDPAGQHGLAGLTADVLDEGTGAHDALGLARELERLGATLHIAAATDYAAAHLDTLGDTLEPSLSLLAGVVSAPRLATDDVARVRDDRLEDIRRRAEQPFDTAGLVLDRVLFGDHPYAHPVLGHADSVSALGADDVQRFHAAHYAPGRSVVVLAGDLGDDIDAVLQRTLGTWPARPLPPLAPIALPGPADSRRAGVVLVDRPGAAQSVVLIGRISMARDDARFFPAELANTVLGGSFSARLNHRLREQLGYTYGARSSFFRGAAGGSWTARMAVPTEVTAEALGEALAQIAGMQQTVPAAELARATALRTRELPQEFETNAGVAWALAELAAYGEPLDWHASYARRLQAVNATEVQAFAASHWRRDALTVVIVGDARRIRAAVAAHATGPIRRHDAQGVP